uniref:PG_binding_1 n=1 Tax=uncultured Xanthomonas sp. TaxID=152831 RepID=A0A060BUI5_9XANT|nr:PG_binding_1 [uncultured Xanthomonas sp.]
MLVVGMTEGWFTGRRLTQFITDNAADYAEARRIINGLDCASEIAALADAYELALDPVATPVLRRGMLGAPVARLQRALGRAGQAVKADGTFGERTEAALRRFQTQNQLTADGIAGPQSWTLLLAFEETAS